jgi:capsular exopolysaccharide synthesis family protein
MVHNNDQKQIKKVLQVRESFKNLRANLTFALADKKGQSKIIMLTSAEQGDGKSTTCINLAEAYSESNGKVLVIDADLRRPRIAQYANAEKDSKGLSDYLGGFCGLDDIIVRPEGLNFDCIFSGTIPPNPSELLMIDEVEEMFKILSEKYDYILIDTPPVGIVAETIYLTQFVSGVIVVVKKDSSHFYTVKEAINLLEFANANILGFVINDAFDLDTKKYYYKRKKYYYD